VFRPSVAVWASAALVALFALGLTLGIPEPAPGATVPPIFQACGSIRAVGGKLKVDITEVRRPPRLRCSLARSVMRRFLRRHPTYGVPGTSGNVVHFRGRSYDCYASRPDGEGWDYHCNWFSSSGNRFFDFGAGRRF